ncbi:unnamed protein product [Hyaloperonospora brassicae]|uniref:Ubiquitin-like domain-containing protein n=1 Tax=Hyaloperonospora brassicae TaxID=162125 RepID=A0AAV0V3B6_HYABA|nr:unnamed protein product [Hyaloperonospora brassicae]
MSDKSELRVTVVFGNQSTAVSIAAHDAQALKRLKTTIAATFDLAPNFQRLVLRGRDVETSTVLTTGCKLLLLRNRLFYEHSEAAKHIETSRTFAIATSAPPVAIKETSPVVARALKLDVTERDNDVVVVHVFRGKSRYDGIFPCTTSILDVKVKVSAVLGLPSPQALRLLVKGRTPADDTVLKALAGGKTTMKVMALLREHQHVTNEKMEELRELLNELVASQTTLQRLEKQIARNFLARDESLLHLSRVLDDGQRIVGNLELVKQHMQKSTATGPMASKETLTAIAQAIQEAHTLAERAQGLLEKHAVV